MFSDTETSFIIKPVELLDILVKQSSKKGELILDPFMWAGSTGIASIKNKRRFIGCDLSENAFKITKERIINENYT